ncbi:TIGR04104 family putative zinc finger protein [Alkalicoccus chagannorensis]|uniref:TIGR04104 family putative zinc finger protein n=1 Tax=Alkalicoccus chagannorensis TaxID=427072 RepID=UPI00054E2F22|nr:TIGR04104 family putative zinc finger protein [Alkalicoccus chagannorensis]
MKQPTLPTCDACQNTLSWKQSLNVMRAIHSETACPHCGENQHLVTSWIGYVLIFLFGSVLPLTLALLTDLTWTAFLLYYAVAVPGLLLLLPLFSRLASKDPAAL